MMHVLVVGWQIKHGMDGWMDVLSRQRMAYLFPFAVPNYTNYPK